MTTGHDPEQTTTPRMTVGWLGTGRMGAAMAARLVDAGNAVTVWNRTTAKTTPLVERGASSVASIHELATRDIVFIMVSTPADLVEVVNGPDGLLTAPAVPALIVDCSTVSVDTSAIIRAAAVAAGVAFLAAPISGNPHVVAAGGSCIVASGPVAAFDAAKPFLDQIAKVAVYAGEAEQSRLVKLCTNLYLGMMVQALVEVTSLAEKGGTNRAAFLDFLNGTVLASDWVRRRTPDLIKRDWTPTFTTELLRKDFDLGLASARELEVPMPIGSAVYQLIQSAIGVGLGDEDFLSLYDQQARVAGLDPAADGRTCS
jgi:3-hydroxyisobutyrate dehydrogenase-like beta-hydroxyacid dehydrogenase